MIFTCLKCTQSLPDSHRGMGLYKDFCARCQMTMIRLSESPDMYNSGSSTGHNVSSTSLSMGVRSNTNVPVRTQVQVRQRQYWGIVGVNCTGDLRILGVIAILKRNFEHHLICEFPDQHWIVTYLRCCGVQVHIGNDLYNQVRANFNSDPEQGQIVINALGGTQITNVLKIHYLITQQLRRVRPLRGAAELPDFSERNFSQLQEDFKNRICSFTRMDLNPKLRTDPGSLTRIVVWIKGRAKARSDIPMAYHEEHRLSRSLTANMLQFLCMDYHRATKKSLLIIVRDETPDKSTKIRDIVNNGCLGGRSLCVTMDDYLDYTTNRKVKTYDSISLIAQYSLLARTLPLNTLHYGGRSGHLEPMIFLGHRVAYYEDSHNRETNRIHGSLCQLTGPDRVPCMYRIQGEGQTKRGQKVASGVRAGSYNRSNESHRAGAARLLIQELERMLDMEKEARTQWKEDHASWLAKQLLKII